jgi:hypothetical protein
MSAAFPPLGQTVANFKFLPLSIVLILDGIPEEDDDYE